MKNQFNRVRNLAATMVACGALLALPVWSAAADEETQAEAPTGEQAPGNQAELDDPEEFFRRIREGRGGGDEEDKPLAKIEEKTKGMQKLASDGFISLWRDEKKDKLYAEIPGKMLGKDMLLAVSSSQGIYPGMQAGDLLVRIERLDDKALIIEPQTFYKAEGTLERVVESTYPDMVLATSKIMAEGAGNSILIDLKDLLSGEIASYFGGGGRAKLTQVTKAKAFPENSVIEITWRGPDGNNGLYFNFYNLPNTGYKPRRADLRVGYFLTAQTDFSKDETADTVFDRYICRWNIEKADNSLKLSPPKEPIVIYLDQNIPVKFRRWVREGLEEWNKAFESIGIVDAIVVRQQTDSNEFKDMDPEDARYNFVRWITSQQAFAVAPSRTDPRTGQILDTDILFDESMVRYQLTDYDSFVNNVPQAETLSPQLRAWLAENPQEAPNWEKVRLDYLIRIQNNPKLAGQTPESIFASEMMATMDQSGPFANHSFCQIGHEMRNQVAFARLNYQFAMWSQPASANSEDAPEGGNGGGDAGDDGGKGGENGGEEENGKKKKKTLEEWPEDFIGPIVKEIVGHEFGHSLGLRHNFKASTWKSYSDVIASTDHNVATTGSLMDYNAFTLKPDGTMPAQWITPTIGPYDHWAIEYGYAIPGTNEYPKNEEKMLAEILKKVSEPGHDYGTDEDVASPDPTINRWDMGQNPLDYYMARVSIADNILKNLLDITVEDGESYSKARDAFGVLMSTRYFAAAGATKYIGGYNVRRDYKGDPGARSPIEVVDAKTQRAAMDLIVKTVLAEDAFVVDPKVQNFLVPPRWSHRDSTDWYASLTYPVQDTILGYQRNVLFSLTNPDRIRYVYDAEFHVPAKEDIFSLPELFSSMTNSVWSEVVNDKVKKGSVEEPGISHMRRNLQRDYLGRLITISTSGERSMYPAVARTLAWKQIKDLGAKIDDIIKDEKLDPWTAAHLEESSMRIHKALDASYNIADQSTSTIRLFGYEPQPAAATSTTVPPGIQNRY